MALIYATKFIVRVREEDLILTMYTMESSVLPVLGSAGFVEPLVFAKRRRMERMNREKTEESLSGFVRMMVEDARRYDPHDSELEGDLNSLKYGLIHGVHSHAHGMIHHHKTRKRPEEYELLRREMYEAKNRESVAGVQLDIYAFHSNVAPLAAEDDLDPTGSKPNLPFMLRTLDRELEGLQFLKPSAIKYAVLDRSLSVEGRYALQTFVAATTGKRGADPRDIKARARSLVKDLMERFGTGSVLALRSLRDGVSGSSKWYPNGIPQHRGDEPSFEGEDTRGFPDIYEIVTLWKLENARNEAAEWLSEKLPEVVEDVESGYGGFAVRSGKVWGAGVDFRPGNGVA